MIPVFRTAACFSVSFDPSNLEQYSHLKPTDAETKRVLADKRKLDEDPVTDLFLKVIESIRLEQDHVMGQTVKVSAEHKKATAEHIAKKARGRSSLSDQWTLEPPSTYTYEPWMFGRKPDSKSKPPSWLSDLMNQVDSNKPLPIPNYMLAHDTDPYYDENNEPLPGTIPFPFKESSITTELKKRYIKEKGKDAKFISKIEEMSLKQTPEIPSFLTSANRKAATEDWAQKRKNGQVPKWEKLFTEAKIAF